MPIIDENFWLVVIGRTYGLWAMIGAMVLLLLLACTIVFFISWFINCSVEEEWQSPIKYMLSSISWMWRKQ